MCSSDLFMPVLPMKEKLNGLTDIVSIQDEKTDADLENSWINCMAHKSGAKNTDGHMEEPGNFDQSVERCTFTVYRNTGKTYSPEAFEKAKAFWEPGYWNSHELPKIEEKIMVRGKQS